ncbi:protein LNK3-like isoform X1 [Senna tora]|uniref:Protein LNK3-like isoform X1 n=1 Tax=Senna tora TaxID=362788 RepID=A0A834XB62_9FABA|nr:protein LNK3-like isoform X1 [Senna tora]
MEEEQGATIQPEDVPQDLYRGQPWGKDPIDGKRWIYLVNDDSSLPFASFFSTLAILFFTIDGFVEPPPQHHRSTDLSVILRRVIIVSRCSIRKNKFVNFVGPFVVFDLYAVSVLSKMAVLSLTREKIWDSMLETLPNVENLNKALCFPPKPQFNNTPGGLQKDIAASKFVDFVSCNSKYEDCLDVEPAERLLHHLVPPDLYVWTWNLELGRATPVKLLDPFEQSSIDEGTHQQSSLEESILLDLEMAIAQFTEKTRLCFRDALY